MVKMWVKTWVESVLKAVKKLVERRLKMWIKSEFKIESPTAATTLVVDHAPLPRAFTHAVERRLLLETNATVAEEGKLLTTETNRHPVVL